jgi:outer membrane protein OmpA-like peptidoglycan-associated protein
MFPAEGDGQEERYGMRVIGVMIAGAMGIVALGIATAHWQAPGVFGQVTGLGRTIEQRVETAAQSTLHQLGFDWAHVSADGQIVTLTGNSPREEESVMAVNAILNAMGPGGLWRGGVISVIDRSEIAPIASPFVWRVSKRDGEIIITGVVPSRESRREILEYAKSLFTQPIRSEMQIARGAPAEQSWITVARTALSQVAALEAGDALLKDTRLTVEGSLSDAFRRERIRDELTRLPSPFVAAARLDGAESVDINPLIEVLTEQRIRDVSMCQSVIDELLQDAAIQFEQASSMLEKDSYASLDRIAIALKRCDEVQIEIRGHTDNSGDPDSNLKLSGNRAQRILDYLVLNGLESERLRATGLGDAEPIANNDSEFGRSQNRRIEIVVTR